VCALSTGISNDVWAKAEKFRLVWSQDPSRQATIAWHQASGSDPVLLLDINDFGDNPDQYGQRIRPEEIREAKGMQSHFIRLKGLRPNMTYYFLIKDSEGTSRRLFFTTAPDNPSQRLSIIAGGDSRNHRTARQHANLLVAKLKPHCVLFGGDFTGGSSPLEWQEWLDDWQLTIAEDGRMTPVVVTRGNHEEDNRVLTDLFGLEFDDAYYALTLGGNLLRVYTLNTMMSSGGEQRDWLEQDLATIGTQVVWRAAQYHHPMRPHTARKPERNDLVSDWGPLFYRYGVDLAVECDAHVAKSTYPIRVCGGQEACDEGFLRDDETGTVFIGEGCWGAPLRQHNDDKSWTRASGSFNHFNWIFADESKIEVRVVQVDNAPEVGEVNPSNVFKAPVGLTVWNPPTGDVIVIRRRNGRQVVEPLEMLAARSDKSPSTGDSAIPPEDHQETEDWDNCPLVLPDAQSGQLAIKYALQEIGSVTIRLVNPSREEVLRMEMSDQAPGEHLKTFEVNHLKPGRYLAIVKNQQKVLRRYRVIKR
jgi:hypothetical protein